MGPRSLVNQPQSELPVAPEEVKIKVTHVLLSNFDALCYSGELPIAYPKTVGRYAIGLVTECGEKVYGVQKGERVFIKGARPCMKCLHCRRGDVNNCEHIQIAGIDFDGFLRDFVVCDYRRVAVLPDEVDDLHALCIEHVAFAENIFDQLHLSAGSKVAVVGGNALAFILAQVAIYHKYVPVVIDDNPASAEKFRRAGVYYTVPADDDIDAGIAEATSGMKCDAAIYISCSRINPDLASRVLARDKTLVLEGMAMLRFKLDALPLFRHNTRVITVTDGFGYTESAINMILHGAINLGMLEKEIMTEYDPAAIFERKLSDLPHNSKLTIAKLIF